MFDWSSFLSGVLGALIGGAAALIPSGLGRRDQRRLFIREKATEILAEVRAIRQAVEAGTSPIVDGVWQGDVGSHLEAYNGRVVELTMLLKRRDKVVAGYLSIAIVDVMAGANIDDRFAAAAAIESNLAAWTSGEFKAAALKPIADEIHDRRFPSPGRGRH